MARGWPDDAAFTARLLDFALYRREPQKGRLILETLERSFGHKEGPNLRGLTVEHVMPQKIEEGRSAREWKAMLGADWAVAHEAWLHTLGNLTLTGYNPKLSNRPFPKKNELFARSNIQLNDYFLKLHTWDAEAIKTRGSELAKKAAQLWPRPSGAEYVPGRSESDDGRELGRPELRRLPGKSRDP